MLKDNNSPCLIFSMGQPDAPNAVALLMMQY